MVCLEKNPKCYESLLVKGTTRRNNDSSKKKLAAPPENSASLPLAAFSQGVSEKLENLSGNIVELSSRNMLI